MKTAVVRARAPEKLKQDFETAATSRDWDLSHAIRQLMPRHVSQEKELTFRREETMEALEDIAAGRTIEGDKVLDWLETWGTDNEQEPPIYGKENR